MGKPDSTRQMIDWSREKTDDRGVDEKVTSSNVTERFLRKMGDSPPSMKGDYRGAGVYA